MSSVARMRLGRKLGFFLLASDYINTNGSIILIIISQNMPRYLLSLFIYDPLESNLIQFNISELSFIHLSLFILQSSSIIEMKHSHLSAKNRLQITEEHGLDPLDINEIIFQQKVFLPLVISNSEESNVYPIIFKIMRQKNHENVLIYLLSQADLYFLYKIEISSQSIIQLNHQFNLSFKKLSDFVEFLRFSLEDIQNQLKVGILRINSEQEIEFFLNKDIGSKSHLVMMLSGRQECEEITKAEVAYRYGFIRQRIRRKQEKIEQLREIIKIKNPILLKTLNQIRTNQNT